MAKVITTDTAWNLIGFPDIEGYEAMRPTPSVRIKGGRTLYEAVLVADGSEAPRLARIEAGQHGLRQINRYIDPDTILEVVTI